MQDLINRQAALDAIDVLKRNYPSSCFEDLCKAVDIAIKALSAQLEPSAVARDIATIIENERDMRVIASAQPTQSNAVQHVESVGDCISRQAAIDVFKRELTTGESKREYVTTCCAIGYEGIKRILESIPSALPEIIRCKDCRHRDVENGFCEGRGWPMQLVPDDGFCDKGERI